MLSTELGPLEIQLSFPDICNLYLSSQSVAKSNCVKTNIISSSFLCWLYLYRSASLFMSLFLRKSSFLRLSSFEGISIFEFILVCIDFSCRLHFFGCLPFWVIFIFRAGIVLEYSPAMTRSVRAIIHLLDVFKLLDVHPIV